RWRAEVNARADGSLAVHAWLESDNAADAAATNNWLQSQARQLAPILSANAAGGPSVAPCSSIFRLPSKAIPSRSPSISTPPPWINGGKCWPSAVSLPLAPAQGIPAILLNLTATTCSATVWLYGKDSRRTERIGAVGDGAHLARARGDSDGDARCAPAGAPHAR